MRFKFAPKPLLFIYLVNHFYFSSCIFLVVFKIIFLGKNETRDNCIFCDLDETEITSSFPLIIALYPSSATLLAEAISVLNNGKLSPALMCSCSTRQKGKVSTSQIHLSLLQFYNLGL
jgi:hypothetical protein